MLDTSNNTRFNFAAGWMQVRDQRKTFIIRKRSTGMEPGKAMEAGMSITRCFQEKKSAGNDINITNPAEGRLLEAPSSPTFLNAKCPPVF